MNLYYYPETPLFQAPKLWHKETPESIIVLLVPD
jgi:hypothetical protein